MARAEGRLSSHEAAASLGVKPATLYAYVSRGLLDRDKTPAGSTFDATEVARLAASRRQRGSDGRASAGLAFATALTLIEDGRLSYRGLDAVELSRSRHFEEVAWWLWTGSWAAGERWETNDRRAVAARIATAGVGPAVAPIDRVKMAVVAAGSADVLRWDLSRAAVIATARDLLTIAVDTLPAVGRRRRGEGIAEKLWLRLSPLPPTPARVSLVDAALVLVADHELAPSTLCARVAAAFGADPYSVVSTGLGPASGQLHSAVANEVHRLFDDALDRGPMAAIGERLARGEPLRGLGMRLYPDGDPRGGELLRRLDGVAMDPRRRAVVDAVMALAAARGLDRPNVDFGLGALAFGAEMVPGAGQAIMVIGRMAGWLAHALEEYESHTVFRARATYVGPRPGTVPAAPAR
ncbi:MAG: citrate synthase [Actinomycetota bacterium]|nr:citrate synthase [Actinomycetota bacterium]